ncbi:hypothetical protein ACU8NH_03015 [Rhizobium leguminosarum]|jgi:hypothetical protein|uniref:Uncharacterized protein n=2 Tax=Rhizobium TaxID=379 RepID=A0A2Z4YJT8_RHILE|nr:MULTISPECIES: hypothetical protein [Rhizobium]ASS54246.1 hypothetical protein CHR56_06450 [Rhizobium leguminosarum bv. viciae]AVC48466.1 hypothetical protein RLV_3301 [Rhizobium leguminosarum bv. viciae]AXA41466.1 hypothetical protein DLJ82_3901 [Rhizobium leguminosarum]MBB4329148.1 hypothetical protein [Rhizobium leguminosarum]MBB4344653.1 hypothetical protein [Rhizobium leguminosarum]
MRIVLNRIAVPNPSIDKTTPNLQAGRLFETKTTVIEHLQQNAIMAPRHMKQSREIIKTSSVKRGFSPRFPHNLGYPPR